MASAQVIRGIPTDLFRGKKFWFSARVPQRARFSVDVETNGGIVVRTEKDADIKIVDHMAKEVVPETYSYRYIDLSIRKGQLENLEDHAVGPRVSSVRPASSIVRSGKQSRTPYTAADDLFIWKSVERYTRQGMKALGNEIYKMMEEQNNRHPWQSWRDRYVKILQYRSKPDGLELAGDTGDESARDSTVPASDSVPCTGTNGSANATNREATRGHIKQEGATQPKRKQRSAAREPATTLATGRDFSLGKDPYYQGDVKELLKVARDVLNIDAGRVEEAWEHWEERLPHRTAPEWQKFFIDEVLPVYRAENAKENPFASSSQPPPPKQQEETPSNAQMGSLISRPSRAAPQYTTLTANRSSQLSTPPHSDHAAPENSTEEADSPRRPSFHPEPPKIPPGSISKSQEKATSPPELDTRKPALEDRPRPAVFSHVEIPTTIPPRFPKRKPTIDDDSDLRPSTPLKRPRPYKRPNPDEGPSGKVREIPSTPDEPSNPSSSRTPSKATPKTPSRFPHNSFAMDQDDRSEDGAEILSPPIGATVPSVSLSEPPSTPPRRQEGLSYGPSPAKETQVSAVDLSTVQEESAFETAPSQLFETAPSYLPPLASQRQSETQTQPESLYSEMTVFSTPFLSQKKQKVQESSHRQELDTQTILTASTQIPDVTLAEPPGGWDAFESPSASEKAVNHSPPFLDDAIASPPGGWQDAPATILLTQQPPPSNQSQAHSKPRDISEWIVTRTSDKLTPKQASEVLMSTSMDANLADVVLGYLRRGKKTPSLRGVWTKEDDADLEGEDGRGIKRLLQKHGDEGVERRWEFLEMWRNG